MKYYPRQENYQKDLTVLKMVQLRKQGLTLEGIGTRFGLSRQRISVMLQRYDKEQKALDDIQGDNKAAKSKS